MTGRGVCVWVSGTGNVIKIQELLQVCKEHIDPEKEDDMHQALAVLGIALIAMGEEIGSEMAIRSFNHLVGRPARGKGGAVGARKGGAVGGSRAGGH